MSLLSARDAAILANGVYKATSSTSTQDVLETAQQSVELGNGIGAVESITPKAGLVGQSGAFIKETSGFGMVLERGATTSRETIVVLRGTQTASDWLSNFNIGFDRGPDGSLIHAGFNRIYRTFADDLRAAISRANPQRIHFVGHSLGGALASIAASEYAGIHKKPSYLYTFGAPRVGSLGLCSTLRTNLPVGHVKRVYAISDPVPMIPWMPFCHYSAGSTGINAGFSSIAASAHNMLGSYIPNMPPQGWPASLRMPNRSDPDYWMDMAERSTGLMSSMGYFFLGKALEGIMAALDVLGLAVSAGMTMLDRLITALRNAVLLQKEMAKMTFRFAKLALKIAGRASIAASVSIADLTLKFLRFVFDVLSAPVKVAANLAARAIS